MRLSVTLFATVISGLLASTAAAAPVQWTTNGHYYQLVSPAAGITWTDALTAATSTSFLGVQGHLATFSSQAEFNFVTTNFPVSFTWIGYYDPTGVSLDDGQGGTGSQHAANFAWADGEPNSFTAWLDGEPNNQGNNEYYAWYENRSGWGWNDAQNLPVALTGSSPSPPTSYLIEYDTPVPEPTSLALLALGGFALSHRRRRRA